MASRGSTSFFVPTAGSTTQLEELGVTAASGFQDLKVRAFVGSLTANLTMTGGTAANGTGLNLTLAAGNMTVDSASCGDASLKGGGATTGNGSGATGGGISCYGATPTAPGYHAGGVDIDAGLSAGTNVSGTGNLNLYGSAGSGSNVGGDIVFFLTRPGASGTTVQTRNQIMALQAVEKQLSGTANLLNFAPTFSDAGSTSSTAARGLFLNPTINYTAASKTGSYEALTISAVETSLPSGSNYLIRAQAGAAGTTDRFAVDNTGSIKFATIDASSSTNAPVLKHNQTFATPGNPAGAASATDLMCGLALSFTPRSTGRVLVVVGCNAANNTAGKDNSVSIRFGTGTAPTNGAAVTGTQIGGSSVGFSSSIGFSQAANVSGINTTLSVGTAYWFDLAQSAPLGGTITVTAIGYAILEI